MSHTVPVKAQPDLPWGSALRAEGQNRAGIEREGARFRFALARGALRRFA